MEKGKIAAGLIARLKPPWTHRLKKFWQVKLRSRRGIKNREFTCTGQ